MKLIKYISILICLLFVFETEAQSSVNDINTFDAHGKTALIKAILNKNIDEVKLLLQKGAKINLAETKGLQGTPLMYAASTGNIELCKLLIDNGAKINQVDINKDHALNWATYYGYVNIMHLLIEKGADLTMKSKHGTAVDVALRLWHHDSVAQPFKNTLLARRLSKSENKLIKAVLNNNLTLVSKLLKKELDVDTTDELGTPILQHAAQQGNYQMVKLFIDHKANLNAFNRVGQTPLAWAARYGHLSIAELLLRSGANINAAGDMYKLTPLIASAVNGNVSMAALLIENNADIDIKDVVNTASALHWALWYNHSKVANLLLHYGADYTYKALDNTYSAYDVAKLSNIEEVLLTMKAITQSKNKLIGSWKVQEIHYQYEDTTYIARDLDHGRFIFSDSSYSLMYNPRMEKRTPFKNLSKPESEEIIKAFTSIVFNN